MHKECASYFVDFYYGDCQLVIEIEGSSYVDTHEYDIIRDLYLVGLDLNVIHIQDIDVENNLKGVMK
nr:DUF559 domain-containing protein [Francisella tularensis]